MHRPLLRDALQQASLDSSVRAIHYQDSETEWPCLSVGEVVLDRCDGRFLLRACQTRARRGDEEVALMAYALERHGLRLLERDASDIQREPLCSNARTVWSYVRYNVSIADRLRIAVALEEGGPQSILELEERARPTCDIFAAVCALACENLLGLHIQHAPLGLRTIVFGQQ
ncbi:hypothetical protein BSZ18_07290 [Bradyrhizobium canariense]|uniref:Uncharacterized protein n=1 Tax=Bradyrhizobium canariense TaxID=255045 RepID=A0A1X3HBW1_9BRAD|nr:hypothetical protein BSZ18_07290 [Bradyrhizobium canariense]